MKNPEKFNFNSESQEKRELPEERLKKYLEQMAEELREKGVPVNKECRIDMEAFEDVYSPQEIERDKEFVRCLEKKWYGDLPKEELEKKRIKQDGEKFEMFKTLIFHKFTGENFLVVRTSSFDDFKNKVDNFIIEKETGNPVCAYDELASTRETKLEEKREKMVEINKKGGAQLKYGIDLRKGKIVKQKVKEIPLFYLTFPQKHLKEAIERTSPLEEKDKYEQKVFEYFLALMDYQIKLLKLQNLPHSLAERLESFERTLSKLKSE